MSEPGKIEQTEDNETLMVQPANLIGPAFVVSGDKRLNAIEEVFGLPDTWTVCPVTYGEMNPALYQRPVSADDEW
jgi:hypothetical protein